MLEVNVYIEFIYEFKIQQASFQHLLCWVEIVMVVGVMKQAAQFEVLDKKVEQQKKPILLVSAPIRSNNKSISK